MSMRSGRDPTAPLRRAFLLALVGMVGTATAVTAQAIEEAAAGFERILVERHGPIIVGKFNNPPRQVMDMRTNSELATLTSLVARDDDIRVLVLTGADPKFFIAHFDVRAPASEVVQDVPQWEVAPDRELPPARRAHPLEALPKPVICAINGQAYGGGLELALACDFRFASTAATVGLPEATVGIIPGAGGTQRLPRLIGPSLARELMYFGHTLDAATARELGIVDRVFEPEALMAETFAFAHRLAAMPPVSLAEIKRAMVEGLERPLGEGLAIEGDGFRRASRSSEYQRLWFERWGEDVNNPQDPLGRDPCTYCQYPR
jgi:enoyl-CoA hydratase